MQNTDPYSPEGHDPYEPEGEERPYDPAVDKFWDEPDPTEGESEPVKPAESDFPEDVRDWSNDDWNRLFEEFDWNKETVESHQDRSDVSEPADYESGDYPDDPEGGDTPSQKEASQSDPNADVVEDMQQETEDWFDEETVESHQDRSDRDEQEVDDWWNGAGRYADPQSDPQSDSQSDPSEPADPAEPTESTESTEPTDLWDKPSEEWTEDDWGRFSEYEKSARGRDVDPHEPLDADENRDSSESEPSSSESNDPVEEPTDLWGKPTEHWTDDDWARFENWRGEEQEFSDPDDDPDEGWREDPTDCDETGQALPSQDSQADPYEGIDWDLPEDFGDEENAEASNGENEGTTEASDPTPSASRQQTNPALESDDIPW